MRCSICKFEQRSYKYRVVITQDLADIWKLTPKEKKGFNFRESNFCHRCGSSFRSRALAEAIMQSYPESKSKYFIDWIEWAKTKKLTIAEINYCGHLHQYLSKIPGVKTSQYRESTWKARLANFLKGIKSEDMTHLSYKSNSFDLVLHSEVIEHISDTKKALSESKRILNPEGICLFTTPLIFNRRTKKKAEINRKTKNIKYYGAPSFHGSGEEDNLVFWEFGGDFIKKNKLKIALAYPENYTWVLKLNKKSNNSL